MRPFLVLLLVAAAVGAFFFAMNLGGDSDDPRTVSGPETGPAVEVGGGDQNPALVDPEPARKDRVTTEGMAAPDRTDVLGEEVRSGNGIRGRVQLEDGTRVKNAQVTLSRFDPFDFLGGVSEPDDDVLLTSTNGKGEFVFVDVDPFVQYTVTATHPEHGRRQESHVQVADGEVKDGLVIVLRPGARLFGRVTDSGGNAVGGAELTLGLAALGAMAQDPNALRRTSAADGTYSFPSVPDGNYSLDVVKDGWGRVSIPQLNVTGEGDLEQNVQLEVAHMIAGRVVDPAGAPVPEAEVQAWGTTGRTQQTRSTVKADETGGFLFDDIAAGAYTLFVRAEGFKNERYPRADTGDMSITIALMPLPRIRGQALAPDGQPLRDFDLNLRVPVQNTEDTIAIRETDTEVRGSQDGRFDVPCPNQGEYVVEVRCPPYAPTLSDRVTVGAGAEVGGIIVRMSAGGAITGRVVDFQGEPVAGARLQTHDSEYVDDPFFRSLGQFPSAATEKEGVTGNDGRFRLDGLTPETYQLDVRHMQHAQLIHQGIVVREGQPTDVGDLRLSAGATVIGTVLGPDGAPLPGATVQLRSDGEDAHSYTARTDSEGGYRVLHVPEGTYFIFAQRAPDPSNPFQGPMDQKKTQRSISVREGQTQTAEFTITN